MTITVIAIALALPASFYVLIDNIQDISGGFEGNQQISVFLQPEINDDEARSVAGEIAKNSKVEHLQFMSKKESLQEFQTYSGFGEILKALDTNPLPAVIRIQPRASLAKPEELQALVNELRAYPKVDMTILDMQWVYRLHAMLQLAKRGVYLLTSLLAIAVIMIIGNTIRLELYNRQEEIVVTKLLGATDAFIRRPFLYGGFWYGLAGGVIAWLLVSLICWFLQGPIQELTSLYQSAFQLKWLGLARAMYLLAFSIALGVVGSLLVVTHYLHKLHPE